MKKVKEEIETIVYTFCHNHDIKLHSDIVVDEVLDPISNALTKMQEDVEREMIENMDRYFYPHGIKSYDLKITREMWEAFKNINSPKTT